MKKINILLSIVLLALVSCNKAVDVIGTQLPPDLNLQSKLAMKYPRDANGYYLVPIDTNTNSNRFNVYVEGSKLNPPYQYNGTSVIEAKFDCNTYWVLGTINGDLTVRIPLYNPFTSLYSSPYFNTPISTQNTTVVLNQYKNSIVSVVPPSGIYLKEYFAGSLYQPADEYKPGDGMYWGKRIVGPIPKHFKGDTITIYSKVSWDIGRYSYNNPGLTTKLDSIKVIFK